ncbi:hypothetical protein RUM43_001878 [Polyplax serrata]|uniref:Uncharacterized protein n=1 Tax=Polyplax serrata TaxID=468196 RepID=A0AAN8SEH3_POLSC
MNSEKNQRTEIEQLSKEKTLASETGQVLEGWRRGVIPLAIFHPLISSSPTLIYIFFALPPSFRSEVVKRTSTTQLVVPSITSFNASKETKYLRTIRFSFVGVTSDWCSSGLPELKRQALTLLSCPLQIHRRDEKKGTGGFTARTQIIYAKVGKDKFLRGELNVRASTYGISSVSFTRRQNELLELKG